MSWRLHSQGQSSKCCSKTRMSWKSSKWVSEALSLHSIIEKGWQMKVISPNKRKFQKNAQVFKSKNKLSPNSNHSMWKSTPSHKYSRPYFNSGLLTNTDDDSYSIKDSNIIESSLVSGILLDFFYSFISTLDPLWVRFKFSDRKWKFTIFKSELQYQIY